MSSGGITPTTGISATAGAGGGITALTGDVTASGTGSVAATIAAGAVTLADHANLAANSIIGNNTGSPATPIALTAAQVVALLAISTATATFTGAFTGTTTDPAPTLKYTKFGSIVVLQIPASTATSNAATFTITGAPVLIRPANTQTLIVRTTDAGSTAAGMVQIDSSGTLTFGKAGSGTGGYTTSGTKGIPAIVITYSLD